MAQTQVAAGHVVYATSLVREPEGPSCRDGVAVRPLSARNPLWIGESGRFPSPIRLVNKAATVANWRVASEFGALLGDIRPDVLHTHSMVELSPAVWEQAARRGVPIVHTLHDYDLLCIRGALFKDGQRCRQRHAACRILSAPKRALHDRIDVVAAVSQSVLDTHLQHGLFSHLPVERRRVVWNPASFAGAPSRVPRAPDAPLRFGFIGRLVDEKGLSALIAACRALPAQGWTLRIAGDSVERARFEAMAQGLPIRFEGYVDAPTFLAQVDVVLCAPLWDEPFGLTTMEAYQAGCRVIGSDEGVIGEAVNRIDPGWTVPPGDVPALTGAMTRAIAAGTALPADTKPKVDALLAQLDPATVSQAYCDLYRLATQRAAPAGASN